MDLPQPPADQDLRNIIDKLAQFVARNGPEFENMTKNKQKNNPKFSFLFGGEHYHYYNYKVNAEQAILRQKNQPPPTGGGPPPPTQNFYNQPPPNLVSGGGNNWRNNPPPAFRGPPPNITNRPPMNRPPTPNQNWGPPIHNKPPPSLMNINPSEVVNDAAAAKLDNLEETIFEAQNQIDAMKEQIKQSEQNLTAQRKVTEEQVLQMTEETIRKSRLEHLESLAQECGMDLKELEATVQPIIDSCTKETIGSGKVWIFQNATSHDRNRLLAHYLAYRVTDSDSNFQLRLHLIYLMNDVVHHCVRKNNEDLKGSLESVAVEMFCSAWLCEGSDPISREGKLTKLIKLWQEKSIFSNVTLSRMREIDETWKSCQDQLKLDYESKIKQAVKPLWDTYQNYAGQHEAFVSHAQNSIKNLESKLMDLQDQVNQSKEIRQPPQVPQAPPPAPSKKSGRGSRWDTGSDGQSMPHASSHDFNPSLNVVLPDLSRPPPGFDGNGPPGPMRTGPPVSPFQEKNLIPTLPYYDLPAGLIVPLISMEDSGYKPLKAQDLRLPPPIPPTDRLLAALDQFYAPPSHDHPRDPEGWEMLGLYEWSRSKTAAIKKKADDIEAGVREASPPPSPDPFQELPEFEKFEDKPPPVKRFRSRSRSRTRSRSRESTPESRPRDRGSPGSPVGGDYALPSHLTKRSPSPSRSPPPRTRKSSFRRSPTPPENAFQGFGNNFGNSGPGGQIASSNKGHQMMQRMGWKGSGLGSSEGNFDHSKYIQFFSLNTCV